MSQQTYLQAALESRLRLLKLRYPKYSMRSFARKAGVSATTMSLIISGGRKVSLSMAEKLCDRLDFEPEERSLVVSELRGEANPRRTSKKATQLAQDQYRALSDWKAFALLSLIQTANFKSDRAWIAKRLGITRTQAEETIDLLLRLKMIDLKDGRMKRTEARYNTTDDVANSALKHSHEETLALAAASLDQTAVEDRDFSWLTLAVDRHRLNELKQIIHRFQEDIYKVVSTHQDRSDEVYRLSVQLFPLSLSLKEKNQ